MKKAIIILLTVVSPALVFAQQQYTIRGTAPDKSNGEYVYLAKVDISNPMAAPINIDSAYIDDGRFIFKVASPNDTTLYSIVHKDAGGMFALGSEELTATYVNGNPKEYFQLRGSTLNDDFSTILEFSYKFADRELELAKKRKEGLAKNEWTLEDEEIARENNKKVMLDFQDYLSQFVKSNISNAAGQYVYLIYGTTIKKEVKDEIESKLSEDIKQKIVAGRAGIAKVMEMMKSRATEASPIKAGDRYIDFDGETLSGEKVKLSSVVGSKKLVLLDFWASWCVPCLKEMPEIIDLHNKYKDQGLQIVGISLDKNREKWKNAVESIGMPWVQFIDSNLSNPVSDIYGAHAIPHTILIDEQGHIAAIGLRGKDLKNKIEEILSK